MVKKESKAKKKERLLQARLKYQNLSETEKQQKRQKKREADEVRA